MTDIRIYGVYTPSFDRYLASDTKSANVQWVDDISEIPNDDWEYALFYVEDGDYSKAMYSLYNRLVEYAGMEHSTFVNLSFVDAHPRDMMYRDVLFDFCETVPFITLEKEISEAMRKLASMRKSS